LGFMSFFTKAVTEALNLFPAVNAQISDKEVIFHDYADIGIAVSSPKRLDGSYRAQRRTNDLG